MLGRFFSWAGGISLNPEVAEGDLLAVRLERWVRKWAASRRPWESAVISRIQEKIRGLVYPGNWFGISQRLLAGLMVCAWLVMRWLGQNKLLRSLDYPYVPMTSSVSGAHAPAADAHPRSLAAASFPPTQWAAAQTRTGAGTEFPGIGGSSRASLTEFDTSAEFQEFRRSRRLSDPSDAFRTDSWSRFEMDLLRG